MKTTITSNAPPGCGYCGSLHDGACPRIKSIAYYPNGNVKYVELHDARRTEPSLFERVFGKPTYRI